MSNSPTSELGTIPTNAHRTHFESRVKRVTEKIRAELDHIKRIAESEMSDECKVGAMFASADIASNQLCEIED